MPAPGRVDAELKEFWVENPWEIVGKGHNLSCYERNRVYLNVAGKGFVDASHLSGADSDGDGRSVVAGDFRNTGRMDLLVRQSGGGALLFYENQFPQRHYLEVSLRGRGSNRLGVGARLVAEAGGRRVVRELYPANTYNSQAPCVVHFGLADVARVDRLTVRWPGGKTQVLTGLAADRHVVIDEGKEGDAAVEEVVPGKTFVP